jgi:8-oxo-dGTP diphosphatase
MQLRAPWTHGGQTWGFPGGARDSHETVVDAALRELFEELGVEADYLEILHDDSWADHGQWSYHTVIARAKNELVVSHNDESVEVRWVPLDEVADLELHPGVRGAWDQVVSHVRRLLQSAVDAD